MKIKLNNVGLNFEVSGNDNGPVVVMAHSLGCNLHMWSPQLSALEEEYQLVRLDMRGHGLSDAPLGPYTLEQLATDVIGVMDHLQLDKVHWVGLSIGGMIGQALLLDHPGRFLSAALCDTMCAVPEAGIGIWQKRIEKVNSEGLQSIAEETMTRWFTADFLQTAEAECNAVRKQLATASDPGYIGCCEAIMGLDYRSRLSQIKIPVTLIVGAEDGATPVAASEVMHELLPSSQLTVLDNASHISNVEQAAAFNKALTSFLAANR